jgi:transposase
MKLIPAQYKNFILTRYRPNCRGNGFEALAKQYGVKGGAAAIKYWYDRWDGTPASLVRKPGAGRPPILSSKEVQQHITIPIRKKNRKFKPVHYTDILRPLQEKTGKKVSLRTVRRYGKENGGINSRNTIKRTAHERKYLHTTPLHFLRSCPWRNGIALLSHVPSLFS